MGNVINIEEARKKKSKEKLVSSVGVLYEAAGDIAKSFNKLMSENPVSAIKKLPEFIEKARNVIPDRGLVEAAAGGPNPHWTSPMLDILGIVYPTLEKDVRKEGLLKCLNFLDNLGSGHAQCNVEFIDEPWLVADIAVNRPMYWRECEQYTWLLRGTKSWKNFSPYIMSAKSEFLLALAVIRPADSSLEIRTNFYKQYPDLIDRTLDAVAAITFERAIESNKRNGVSVDEYVNGRIRNYDPLFHDGIRKKIEEKKWIKLAS
jgi:hypothetical protein